MIITAGSLSLTAIVHAQGGMWYFIPQFIGFLVFTIASFAETNRSPFDLVEADAELVAGYFTEYGGTRMVAVLFAEYLIRATLPRLRYDQLMSFGWKILLPLATVNTLVTAIIVVAVHK